jgi:hypothetical protein
MTHHPDWRPLYRMLFAYGLPLALPSLFAVLAVTSVCTKSPTFDETYRH